VTQRYPHLLDICRTYLHCPSPRRSLQVTDFFDQFLSTTRMIKVAYIDSLRMIRSFDETFEISISASNTADIVIRSPSWASNTSNRAVGSVKRGYDFFGLYFSFQILFKLVSNASKYMHLATLPTRWPAALQLYRRISSRASATATTQSQRRCTLKQVRNLLAAVIDAHCEGFRRTNPVLP
jgi:hypothetical protein